MYQKVKAYMKEHGMVVDGDVVLAGVSGGGDSMAMLEMLKRYQAEAAFSLCAVHVHHGIRGEEADLRKMDDSFFILSLPGTGACKEMENGTGRDRKKSQTGCVFQGRS